MAAPLKNLMIWVTYVPPSLTYNVLNANQGAGFCFRLELTDRNSEKFQEKTIPDKSYIELNRASIERMRSLAERLSDEEMQTKVGER